MTTQHDQSTTTTASQAPAAQPAPAVTSAPGLQVQAMVAQGAGPAEIGQVLVANPAARDEILTYLHTTRGNGFVQQVLSFGPGGPNGGSGQPLTQGGSPTPVGGMPLAQVPVMLADAPPKTDPLVGGKDMIAMTFPIDDQWVQVYVSPGGVDHNPDVFMFFHGQSANLKIDPDMKPQDDDNVSGNDSARSAVAEARAKNTIAILPQGVRGGGGSKGGQMPAIIAKGLPAFLDHILAEVRTRLGMQGAEPITPKHIALAGHSAGGYQGIDEALTTAGKKYSDTISDLTLMDTSYSDTHFEHALEWLFTGSPGKTIRIVQSEDQLRHSHNYSKDPTPEDPDHIKDTLKDPHWRDYFGDGALVAAAKRHKMSLDQIQKFNWDSKDDRGNGTKVVQHTQVMNADGKMQCDILVMQSDLGHHEIRDNVMDDAIDTIGQGAASADEFGKHHIPYYGRDPLAPHYNNKEHMPGEPPAKVQPRPKKRG